MPEPFVAAVGKVVRWVPRFRQFQLDQRLPLRGVTPSIAALFFPRYSASAARRGPLHHRGDARVLAVVGLAGRELGTLVDREVTQLARLAWRHALHWEDLLPDEHGGYPAPPRRLPAKARAELRNLQLNGNLYTRRLLCALRLRGLFPVASQVPVGSEQARLGTAVDLVCVRESDVLRTAGASQLIPGARVVLVELKCGYETNYERYCGAMNPPLAAYRDAPHWQHQLQLLVTRILFERTFTRQGGPVVSDAFVVRVHADGVTVVPTHPWTATEQWAVFHALVATRLATSTVRRRQRRDQRLRAQAQAEGGVYAGPQRHTRTRRRPSRVY